MGRKLVHIDGWKEELISSINNENVNINTGKIISHFPHNVHNSYILWVWVNVTFNNISAILLWSVLLVEKTIVRSRPRWLQLVNSIHDLRGFLCKLTNMTSGENLSDYP
jgi:hypothetical protein